MNARLDEEGGKKDRIHVGERTSYIAVFAEFCFVIVLESRVRAAWRVYPFTPITLS